MPITRSQSLGSSIDVCPSRAALLTSRGRDRLVRMLPNLHPTISITPTLLASRRMVPLVDSQGRKRILGSDGRCDLPPVEKAPLAFTGRGAEGSPCTRRYWRRGGSRCVRRSTSGLRSHAHGRTPKSPSPSPSGGLRGGQPSSRALERASRSRSLDSIVDSGRQYQEAGPRRRQPTRLQRLRSAI